MTLNESKNMSENESAKAATFLVDAAGNITGSHSRKPGKHIVVNNKPGETYTGKIYANHNGHNGTRQLVGDNAMDVGTTYTIHASAENRHYQITTRQPPPEPARPASSVPGSGTRPGPAAQGSSKLVTSDGSNGDLHVGSGGM